MNSIIQMQFIIAIYFIAQTIHSKKISKDLNLKMGVKGVLSILLLIGMTVCGENYYDVLGVPRNANQQ